MSDETTDTDAGDTERYRVKTTVVHIEEVVAVNSFEAEMKAKSVDSTSHPQRKQLNQRLSRRSIPMLSQCKSCETCCEGEFCSEECREYWDRRDQRL